MKGIRVVCAALAVLVALAAGCGSGSGRLEPWDESFIPAQEVERVYNLKALTAEAPYTERDARNAVVTRLLLEPLMEQYDLPLPESLEPGNTMPYEAYVESYEAFRKQLQEYNYRQRPKFPGFDELVAASGLSGEAYYAWALEYERYRYRLYLLIEEFDGDEDAVTQAALDLLDQQGYRFAVEDYKFCMG